MVWCLISEDSWCPNSVKYVTYGGSTVAAKAFGVLSSFPWSIISKGLEQAAIVAGASCTHMFQDGIICRCLCGGRDKF